MFKYTNNTKRTAQAIAVTTALALAPLAAPVLAQPDGIVTMETLLDRIQIEDIIVRYYDDLARGASHELSDYFTDDAMLDVDGMVANGHAEIAALYGVDPNAEPEAATEPDPDPDASYRRGNMLLTNPIIEVTGDTATVHVVWTGVMNEGVGKPPSLYEQGREYSELRKVDGKWLISKRYISSDSGLPDRFDDTWEPREHR